MDLYAEIKSLRSRVEALEALAEQHDSIEEQLTPEAVLDLDEVVAEAVAPAPFQSSEEQAAEEAALEEEVDEAVEAALGPEVPYEGHVEPVSFDPAAVVAEAAPRVLTDEVIEDIANTAEALDTALSEGDEISEEDV